MEMIGFIGLGTIGAVVAGNIREAGYPVMVYDIRPEAVQSLVNQARSPLGLPPKWRALVQ